MKTSRILAAFLLAAALAGPAALAASASDPLALVPAGAASVAVVHLDQLRASPLSARLFTDADKMTADGDAARFMAEADLSPKKDVDLVVVAGMPASSGGETPVLAIFQGRFDPDRLAAAVESRGGTRKSSAGGDYELLPEKGSKPPAAAAFVSRDLVIAGTESLVADALAARRSGTVGLSSSGSALGRYLSRVDRGAAAWAIVDVQRYPSLQRKTKTHPDSEGGSEPAAALASAMKSVSLFAIEATPRGDGLDLAATGLTANAETRQLLEDSLRGLLAMWRLAVQEKQPELVSALRKFHIGNDGEGVTIRGTLPASVIRSMAQKKRVEN
jgi:hypothetical protein